jgi:hypothetical protein
MKSGNSDEVRNAIGTRDVPVVRVEPARIANGEGPQQCGIVRVGTRAWIPLSEVSAQSVDAQRMHRIDVRLARHRARNPLHRCHVQAHFALHLHHQDRSGHAAVATAHELPMRTWR